MASHGDGASACRGRGRGGASLRAVDDVSFQIASGEVLGLVGESGSGKSTLARIVLRLIEPSAGLVRFDAQDVTGVPRSALTAFRKQAQIVFQNPDSSLNPRRTVGERGCPRREAS